MNRTPPPPKFPSAIPADLISPAENGITRASRLLILAALSLGMLWTSCGKISGPRGLRQSEWVAYCLDNPGLLLCNEAPIAWDPDSFYVAGLIFETDAIREYRCDTADGTFRCEWVNLVPVGSEPEITRDSILVETGTGRLPIYSYELEDGFLTITGVNPALSQLLPGTVFTNVEPIPDNHPDIVETP
jgi:hypothetical protein